MAQPTPDPASIGPEGPLSERLRAVAVLFLKLGTISFGGPAAHIALMEDEVVRKRQWVTRQQYLDMLGLTNLIPGPNSTEMAINVGFVRAGWAGLVVAGASFIIPAALITAAVAWAYVRFGTLPLAESLLAGVKPAVIAVIAIAVWRLGKIAVHDAWLGVLGVLALAMFLVKLSPLLILAGGGLIGMLSKLVRDLRQGVSSGRTNLSAGLILLKKSFLLPSLLTGLLPCAILAAAGIPVTKRVPLARLGWFFLKVGAVLYGGGYVLFAFVEQGLVRDHHWLTQQQVLDAIAIGQFTPGPVLSTATFIGYLLGGAWGAVVATAAIFLPSFLYVAALGPILPKLRRSAWVAAFLDSVNVCAVALMAGVTVKLAGDALRGWPMWVIAATTLAVLWKWKINPAWVVSGGGLAGMLLAAVR
ncbi:MAG: chromate efflux transporter [Candidatus Sulfotelmatobacter sp.]